MPSELGAEHTLEFPGGYTRSTGPVIGRFLTELRERRIVGVRTAGGRVLVPPLEYDPATGDPVTGDPANGDPVTGDPANGDPVTGDPANGDPANGERRIRRGRASGYGAGLGLGVLAASGAPVRPAVRLGADPAGRRGHRAGARGGRGRRRGRARGAAGAPPVAGRQVGPVVTGIPDERWGSTVAAVVEPRPGAEPTARELDAHCRARLSGFKVPRVYAFVAEVVRSPAGKADYRWARRVAEAAARS
ncbi:hypothetical protein Misp01_03980 [Microtetraspora sp. NBRC 13810]|nr:hypothetical protein Misp01_03980 [Microtetraspora sp. NBRC 13810]